MTAITATQTPSRTSRFARNRARELTTKTCLTVLGRARLQRPDLERWEQGDEPAWNSPPLAAAIRGGAVDVRRWKPGSRKPLRR